MSLSEPGKEIRASVAMASYNGERYIKEQIDSILSCISDNDELVVSDDGSTDSTLQILKTYQTQDSRVRVVENRGVKGVNGNFENALAACRGGYIFLADQDDVWIDDKVKRVIDVFKETDADMVIHDGLSVAHNLEPITDKTLFEEYGIKTKPIRNFIKCTYFGCCMAIKKETAYRILPFPVSPCVDHDIWLGIITGFIGKIAVIDNTLVLHRIHSNNVTPKKRRQMFYLVKQRIGLLYYIVLKLTVWRKCCFAGGDGA